MFFGAMQDCAFLQMLIEYAYLKVFIGSHKRSGRSRSRVIKTLVQRPLNNGIEAARIFRRKSEESPPPASRKINLLFPSQLLLDHCFLAVVCFHKLF
ncbi:Uncharacterised protein [uncultured archaeon]|nr:Uncharacterised protein [uncultured archaeon]